MGDCYEDLLELGPYSVGREEKHARLSRRLIQLSERHYCSCGACRRILAQFPEIVRKKEARAGRAGQGGGRRRADARQGRQRSPAIPGPLNVSHYLGGCSRKLFPIDQSCALVLEVHSFFLSNRISQQLCPWAIVLPRVSTKSSKTLAIPRSPFMAMSHRTSISSSVQPSFCQASTSGQ